MKRVTFTIAAFLLCLGVVVGAMSWVTLTALRLERGQELARRRAALEEKVRLALWRMDSALTPLIAGESVRPYFVYTAFYPAERSYTRMFAQIRRGEVLLPSPLLTEESPYILLHFQIGADGRMTSPGINRIGSAVSMRDCSPPFPGTTGARSAFGSRSRILPSSQRRSAGQSSQHP